MIKKFLLVCMVAWFTICGASAQTGESFYGIGNRIGVGVGVGTEGIGIDVGTCLSKYVSARVGVNFFPGIKFNTDVDVSVDGVGSNDIPPTVEAEASLARTTVDVKFDCYPFPDAIPFFITAGFSAGGSKLVKISAHSDEIATLIGQGKDAGIDIGDYRIPFDENGNANGYAKVNGFRPYLGIGFGRLIPKKRIGCRVELGVQFHGSPKIYADGVGDLESIVDSDTDDDITELLDKLSVYPVLKFSIRGRIL